MIRWARGKQTNTAESSSAGSVKAGIAKPRAAKNVALRPWDQSSSVGHCGNFCRCQDSANQSGRIAANARVGRSESRANACRKNLRLGLNWKTSGSSKTNSKSSQFCVSTEDQGPVVVVEGVLGVSVDGFGYLVAHDTQDNGDISISKT